MSSSKTDQCKMVICENTVCLIFIHSKRHTRWIDIPRGAKSPSIEATPDKFMLWNLCKVITWVLVPKLRITYFHTLILTSHNVLSTSILTISNYALFWSAFFNLTYFSWVASFYAESIQPIPETLSLNNVTRY